MGTPKGITLSEGVHPFTFLISEDSDGAGYLSRDEVAIAPSQDIIVGQILKKSATGVYRSTKVGGNTGGGAMTLGTPAYLTGAQEGIYLVRCIGGAKSIASAAAAGMHGNGTMGSLTVDSTAVSGIWRVVCQSEATDGGEFAVFKPNGDLDGIATVGVAYNSSAGPNFTIADGSADFQLGDEFDLTVTDTVPSNGGVFSVTDPKGNALANATVGVEYSHEIDFTIADGAPDFAVGDGFDVEVIAEQYSAWGPGDTAVAIAGYPAKTGSAETKRITVINTHATVRLADLTFAGSPTQTQIDDAKADLSASLIKFR